MNHNKLIKDVDNYIINKDETDSPLDLRLINHHLNLLKFPPIPFLWHYNDFGQPYPVYGVKKILIEKLKILIPSDNKINLYGLDDSNTDIYILAQYKDSQEKYSKVTIDNEIYICYHSWLYHNFTRALAIPNFDLRMKFRFLTGLYTVQGDIKPYPYYPHRNNIKTKLYGGVCVNSKRLDIRQAVIHKDKDEDVVKFSARNVCNFNQLTDSAVFISVIKKPFIYYPDYKDNIKTEEQKANCIVLHIFRNVADNNPYNEEYQNLIDFYMD